MIQRQLFWDICRRQQLYDDRRWLHSEKDLLQIRWIWLMLVQHLVDGKHLETLQLRRHFYERHKESARKKCI